MLTGMFALSGGVASKEHSIFTYYFLSTVSFDQEQIHSFWDLGRIGNAS